MKKSRKKKPHRYCIFCKQHTSYLRRHIKLVHKNHPEIVATMALPKKGAISSFSEIQTTRDNLLEVKKAEPQYERERSAKIWKEISYCSHCLIFMSRRFLV